MEPIIKIENLNKTYNGGFEALKSINLNIKKGEIFALLGPNGAGKTTLINTVCGILNATSGSIFVDGHHIIHDYRKARALIGLVPQELTTDTFETVWNNVNFSRGLFGKNKNPEYIEKLLKELSLWEKKDNKIMTLSGGMKRRLLIAKALSHEPEVLFLDEPTAGVDVELRKGMWNQVRALKETGVTIILTTHYIQEAEEMADRVGVINGGEIILVEDKLTLMKKMGKKRISFDLQEEMFEIPVCLSSYELSIENQGKNLIFTYDSNKKDDSEILNLLNVLNQNSIRFKDLNTQQSSLEEIFVNLVRKK